MGMLAYWDVINFSRIIREVLFSEVINNFHISGIHFELGQRSFLCYNVSNPYLERVITKIQVRHGQNNQKPYQVGHFN